MKILYMSISENYGGAERRLIRIFNGMAKNDNQWRLVLLGEKKDIDSFCKQELVNEKIVVSFETPNSVIKYLRTSNSTVIWFFNFDIVICKLLVFKNKTTKYLMTIANYYYSILDFPSWKRKIAFSYVIKRANIIDCLYPSSVKLLKMKYKKELVFPTPIPFTRSELFSPKPKIKTIVFASRLIEDKNIMLLLDSINLLRKTLIESGYKLIICGTGPLAKEVTNYIASNNLESICNYLGRVDTKDVLPISSIFITIMRGENYPSQSLIEAISSGNYCIVGKGKDTNRIVNTEFGEEIEISIDTVSKSIKKAIIACEDHQDEVIASATQFAKENLRYENSLEYFTKLTSL